MHSSDITPVFYIPPIIPRFFPALFSALTPSVNIQTIHIQQWALIEGVKPHEQQFMHIGATKTDVKYSPSKWTYKSAFALELYLWRIAPVILRILFLS